MLGGEKPFIEDDNPLLQQQAFNNLTFEINTLYNWKQKSQSYFDHIEGKQNVMKGKVDHIKLYQLQEKEVPHISQPNIRTQPPKSTPY